MNETTILFLAILHKAHCTHKDLEKFVNKWYEIYDVYEKIISWEWGIYGDWITMERKQKIEENLRKVDKKALENTIESLGINIITKTDSTYPKRLLTIKNAPFILYVRGHLEEKKIMLSIVGSRKSTAYGTRALRQIIPALIVSGCGIVSGWAHGIDAISHSLALEFGWYTLSVFGSSVDIYYPRENTDIFEKIVASGWALISSYPLWSEPEPYMFPQRNEIVAALSDGVIIPEAWEKSGTLITAALALEQWKDVFAFPWDIFRETSAGTNGLIARWEAKSVTKPGDILEEYLPSEKSWWVIFTEKEFQTKEEKDIYKSISLGYNTPDLLGQNTDYTIDTIMITLSLLEIGGHIMISRTGKYDIL